MRGGGGKEGDGRKRERGEEARRKVTMIGKLGERGEMVKRKIERVGQKMRETKRRNEGVEGIRSRGRVGGGHLMKIGGGGGVALPREEGGDMGHQKTPMMKGEGIGDKMTDEMVHSKD